MRIAMVLSNSSLTCIYLMEARNGSFPLLKPEFHLMIQHLFRTHLEESGENRYGPTVHLQLDLSSALQTFLSINTDRRTSGGDGNVVCLCCPIW